MMKIRLEIALPLLAFAFIAYFPLINGELKDYFFQPQILLPFVLVFLGLSILSFGMQEVAKVLTAFKAFVVNGTDIPIINKKVVKGMINYSYASAMLWVLYAIVINSKIMQNVDLSTLVAFVGLAFTYAFILSELLLRPLVTRIAYIQEKSA